MPRRARAKQSRETAAPTPAIPTTGRGGGPIELEPEYAEGYATQPSSQEMDGMSAEVRELARGGGKWWEGGGRAFIEKGSGRLGSMAAMYCCQSNGERSLSARNRRLKDRVGPTTDLRGPLYKPQGPQQLKSANFIQK